MQSTDDTTTQATPATPATPAAPATPAKAAAVDDCPATPEAEVVAKATVVNTSPRKQGRPARGTSTAVSQGKSAPVPTPAVSVLEAKPKRQRSAQPSEKLSGGAVEIKGGSQKADLKATDMAKMKPDAPRDNKEESWKCCVPGCQTVLTRRVCPFVHMFG